MLFYLMKIKLLFWDSLQEYTLNKETKKQEKKGIFTISDGKFLFFNLRVEKCI